MQRCIFPAVLALFVTSLAHAEDFLVDARLLASRVVELHPRGHEIERDPAFISTRDELFALSSDTDLPHFAMAAGRLYHTVNDGHTAVIPVYSEHPEFTWRYPLRLRRFEDGLYVIAAKGDAMALLGSRLTRIAGKEINPLLRDFAAAQASGNRAWPANWTALGMTIPGFLLGLDVANNAMESPVRYEGISSHGETVSADLVPAADGAKKLEPLARSESPLERAQGDFQNFVAAVGDALVFVIGAMEDEEQQPFSAFTEKAVSAMNTTQHDRLVIDLRDNGGGNNLLTEPLRRAIIRSRFNRPGGIFVLVSPQTFSAAMNFATRIERETDALFVGEPTGGSPNHFGDAEFSKTEKSALPYIVSTLRWQDMPPFDKRPWILPDIPASPSMADYLAGRDLALDLALEHQPTESEGSEARIARPWARESQQGNWTFFYEEQVMGSE